MDWLGLKDETARLMFEKDALHIYAAVAIQIAAAILSRRSLGHLLPWLAVLGVALVNEALDVVLGQEQNLQPWQVVGGVHDLINTMVLPTLLLLLCRGAPGLFDWPRPSGIEAAPSTDDPRS